MSLLSIDQLKTNAVIVIVIDEVVHFYVKNFNYYIFTFENLNWVIRNI